MPHSSDYLPHSSVAGVGTEIVVSYSNNIVIICTQRKKIKHNLKVDSNEKRGKETLELRTVAIEGYLKNLSFPVKLFIFVSACYS